MPVVRVKADTLDEENLRFAQAPLKEPLFLNSVPKSGSHLLRNIVRMFVPLDQQYKVQFIQWPNLQQHLGAFDRQKSYLSWGHLLFSDASAIELAAVRKILLVRDPYEWVLARARFFMSEEFSGNINHIKDGRLSVPSLLNLMIFGVYQKAPPLAEIYANNAAAWLGTGAYLVRYENSGRQPQIARQRNGRCLFPLPLRSLRNKSGPGRLARPDFASVPTAGKAARRARI